MASAWKPLLDLASSARLSAPRMKPGPTVIRRSAKIAGF
jgi:hypothetical protein